MYTVRLFPSCQRVFFISSVRMHNFVALLFIALFIVYQYIILCLCVNSWTRYFNHTIFVCVFPRRIVYHYNVYVFIREMAVVRFV